MTLQVTVRLTEIHINDETFMIEKLPDNWDDINTWDQYSYLGEHGNYIDCDSNFYEVEDVYSVNAQVINNLEKETECTLKNK